MFNSDPTSGFNFGGSAPNFGGPTLSDTTMDEDFLALLSSATSKSSNNNNNNNNHSMMMMNSNTLATPTSANPADLGILHGATNGGSSSMNISPPSTESSPSPPNHHHNSAIDHDTPFRQNSSSMASRATRSSNRDALTGEPSSKRKLLDDLDDDESDDDAPQRKFQHTESSASKKASAKRKSIGGQDETRLQKRKEQNRAAQRAFRERKERHVKDLEDKVSMLEQKTDTQAAENENLRELLTRLQQENLQLKQGQFNFTFQSPLPGSSSGTTPNNNSNNNQSSYQNRLRQQTSDANMANATGAAASSSKNANASTQSPLATDQGLMRMLSNASSSSSNASSSANLGVNNISTPQLTNNSASPSEMNLLETFGIGNTSPELNFNNTNANPAPLAGLTPPGSSSMPFTMLDNSFFNNLQASSSSPSGLDYNLLGDLSSTSSFPPMPYQTIAANPMFTSYRDPTANPNAWASFGPNSSQGLSLNTFDELFGGGGPISSTLPSADADSAMASMDDLMPFSFLPDMSNGNPTVASNPFSGLSPISHLATPPSATSVVGQSGVGSSTSGKAVTTPASDSQSQSDATAANVEHSEETCPKTREEFADKVKTLGQGTFGPPVEQGETCQTMPMADATKLNLDIGTAWRAVRQHPQFEECDIDELCAELAQKATCDGSTKVIEAQKIMDLVHSIPERAKQRKANLRARTMT